ncbi:ABC transporter permease [Staphylococcus massiliensis]|uniref:Transport permease protein n=1 Tax=Staphylococcus massiliensis S46 TaxID=1229783 RepID=K9AP25_9STAP|nr:ABC transporter permease [Staphylococcus massiliensis]EKU47776.1 teichoic acid translocation permease [Staphylococcus massiliensis S46]MCG3399803.1 ABC transporter permease [Staphylococcus massiliensis]MCG3401540.1 ABC transporter permease [Staphylococcus massiliensis]PNZ98036.1 ABC transporter permease [Staphylococcus massiliensis CCUG 55927]
MNPIITILKEQVKHIPQIVKLAVYNMKSQYANHYLGVFWNILQPLLQVLVYYLVFGLGIRGDKGAIEGIPFIFYLISGLFPWLFISQSINAGAGAIQSNLGLVTKMKFPSSVLLSISFTNTLFNLLFMSALFLILSLFNQFVPFWHYLIFLYFIIAAFPLLFGISLMMSSLVIVVKDTKNVLQNIIRLGFFMSPIFWSLGEQYGKILGKIASLNPFAYLIELYRMTFVSEKSVLLMHPSSHLYYWAFTLMMLCLGSLIHYRFKDRLLDFQ